MVIICYQGHGGRHACLYCEATSEMKCGVLRTFGSLSTRHEQFLQSGGHRANALKHANCIQPSLIEEEHMTQVLEVFPPAQLHLMLGRVNALLNVLTNVYTL